MTAEKQSLRRARKFVEGQVFIFANECAALFHVLQYTLISLSTDDFTDTTIHNFELETFYVTIAFFPAVLNS